MYNTLISKRFSSVRLIVRDLKPKLMAARASEPALSADDITGGPSGARDDRADANLVKLREREFQLVRALSALIVFPPHATT